MAHDTRSSRKIKDDESNNSIGRQISSKGSSTSGSATSDTSGLRRSSRETPLKKNTTLSPSGTRKSERLEKNMPKTPPVKRKSGRFEKKLTPSPLRRSERAKNHSSASSGSKQCDKSSSSSLMKRKKEKKEKSVKELTLGPREVSKIGKQNVGPAQVKRKNMHAYAYRALFKKHPKKVKAPEHGEEQNRQNKISLGGDNNCGSGVDGFGKGIERREEELNEEFVGRDHERSLVGSDSSVNKFTKETLEDNHGVELSCSSPKPSCMEEAYVEDGDALKFSGSGERPLPSSYNAMTEEIDDAPGRVRVECSDIEKLKIPELTSSTSNGRIHDDRCVLESSHCVIPSKRKRNMVDGDSDNSAVNTSKDAGTENVPVETCGACFKRRRVENDLEKQEFCSCSTQLNQELCGASVTELHQDRGEVVADSTMGLPGKADKYLQELSVDLQTNVDQNTCLNCKRGGKLLLREYWVPVQISNVQLEQYCSNLLSNPMLLQSSSKKDLVGALHDILTSNRKCLDHPYIVDPSIPALLTEGLQVTEYLDVGIKASGKLQLLDMMLTEIKNRSLRVLILFQSISGSGRDSSLGNILDDFVRQRHGPDSYERIESGVIRSEKCASMERFNNKENGRFVFLLESRACLPSIKLSSVDTVIIFGSDWNPASDVKALQKISLDSQSEQIKVFRLYSTCTLEEKVLIFAKQEKILDSHIQNISRTNSQMMLLWGAPYQFVRLDEFHGRNTPASTASILPEESLLKDVVREFLAILPRDGKDNGLGNLSVISKAHQTGGAYSTEIPLFSELKRQHTGEGQNLSFWTKLLEGKHPQWKYCSGLSQRNRKRVQHLDASTKKPEVESDEVVKKRKKVVNRNDDSAHLKTGSEGKSIPGYKEGASGTPADNVACSSPRSTAGVNKIIDENCASTSHILGRNVIEIPESNMFESGERRKLRDAQKSLHLLLKPEISKLCGILQLSDAVKVMVRNFLEYVMNNHHVKRESATILQAFQISLCWTAASLLEQKVDHKESLVLAKQHLNFNCKKEEANCVYSMLRCLKRTFIYRTGIFKAVESPKFAELSSKDALKDHSHAEVSQSLTSYMQKVKAEIEDLSLKQEILAQKDVSKSIKEIQKKFEKKMAKLIEKQRKEKNEVLRIHGEEKEHLERNHNTESAVIRSCFQNNMRTDKLKMLEEEFEEKKHKLDILLEHCDKMQLEARTKLKEKEKQWTEEVQSWACAELLNRSPSNALERWLECSRTSEQVRVIEVPEDFSPLREHGLDKIVHSMNGGVMGQSGTLENVPADAIACSGPIRTITTTDRPINANGALDTMTSGAALFTDILGKNKAGSSGDDQETIASVDPCAKELITDGGTSDNGEVLLHVPQNVCSTDGLEKAVDYKVDALPISDGEVRLEVPETGSSTDGQQGPLSLNLFSAEQNPDGDAVSVPDRETPLGLHETVNSSHGLHNVVSVSPPSSEKQIRVVTVTMPDKEVESGVLETVTLNDGLGNLVSVDQPSSEGQIPEKATEHETVSSSHGLHNVVSASPPSSAEQIHVVAEPMPDKEVELGVLGTVTSDDGLRNLVSVDPPLSEEHIPEKATEHETGSSSHCLHNVVSASPASSGEQIHVVTEIMPDKEVESGVLETVTSSDGLGNLVFVEPPSSEEQIPENATEHETVSSSHVLHNVVSASPTSSGEQIHLVTGTMPDKEVKAGVLETVTSNDSLGNLVSVDPPSSEGQIPEKATEHETVSSSHGLHNVVSASPPSSGEQIHVETGTMQVKEVESGVLETVTSNDGLGNLVSVDTPSSEEQISEKATENENSEVQVMASDSATTVNQQNGVDTSVNGNSYPEVSLVYSPTVQPATALVHGGSVTRDQAQQDNGTLLATSTAVQDGDAQGSEKQNTCQPVENPVSQSVAMLASDHSDHEVPANEPVVQLQLLTSSNTPDHSPPESSAGGNAIQPSSEDHSFNQVAQAPMQFAQAPNRPMHTAPRGVSRMPLPLYTDPLQNELERLIKETDQTIKSHEDTKLRLKSDCDKEMEEALAEIRRKYEIRFQENETEFLSKKKELDARHNKVLMNKILAEAFRSKCMDLRASIASGVQQDGNSSFVQQLFQLSMEQNAQRPSSVASSSLASPPAANLQTSIAPLPSMQTNPPAPATTLHYTAPSMQTVPLLPAVFPTMPRPPHISSVSPSTVIPQGGGEIRAPAPHLQPFRPSTTMPSQQSHSNYSATPLPHPRLPAPTPQSVPYNRAHHPESAGGLPALRSLSALELLMDMNTRSGANPPGSLPSQSNLGSNLDQSNPSDPAIMGGAGVNPVHTGGPTDIVCLSDDD